MAARPVELTLGEPLGLVPDLAGPNVHQLPDLVRAYLRARGKHRLMMPLRLPGKAGRAYRSGENLSFAGITGRRTWKDFLAERVSSPGKAVGAAGLIQPERPAIVNLRASNGASCKRKG